VYRIAPLVAVSLLIVACSKREGPLLDGHHIQQHAWRHAIRAYHDEGPVFLSLGCNSFGVHVDPGAEIAVGYNDLPMPVHPVGEIDAKDFTYRDGDDVGAIYFIEVQPWTPGGDVDVTVGREDRDGTVRSRDIRLIRDPERIRVEVLREHPVAKREGNWE